MNLPGLKSRLAVSTMIGNSDACSSPWPELESFVYLLNPLTASHLPSTAHLANIPQPWESSALSFLVLLLTNLINQPTQHTSQPLKVTLLQINLPTQARP